MDFRNQSFMIFIDCIYFFNFYRNVGLFRKRLPEYNEDNIEMNNSIDCAIPLYHDTVLNTGNGSVPKGAIRSNTAVNTSTGERQNKTYFSNYEYAVVVKNHLADPAAQPSEFDLERGNNQSQRFETEDEHDSLKHTVDKGEVKDRVEGQLENNVYNSSLGACDGVDPTYNSIKIGPVNNDTTDDHTSNIVQKQVNSDTTNGGLPKNAIRNNTAESTSTGGERQNSTYFSNHEYAVVVKKHPAGPAAQSSEFELEGGDNQSQRFETEDEYDTLKHTVEKGEELIENNVYDSSLGVCDGVDPTYNSIKIGPVNNDTTYDHISNIVQIQVNNDTTYDHTSNIIQP
jgi:hypothetical protein